MPRAAASCPEQSADCLCAASRGTHIGLSVCSWQATKDCRVARLSDMSASYALSK